MMIKGSRYTVVFRTNGQTLMHSSGKDRDFMIMNLLSMLERENTSTQAELLDSSTNEVVFSSRKTAY